jgi:DNA-binding LacI/PurR family transcriptional regulator
MIKNHPATIKDIARKLNVSVTAVSKALRGMPDISPQTKQLILKTAREMDYQPNPIAQSLVNNQTKTIGVLIPSFTIPFYASVISGIQKTATQAGYNLVVCQSDESYETEVNNTRTLLNSRVDGVIVSLSRETADFSHFSRLLDRNVPVVLFNRITEELPVSRVVVDDYKGSYQVVEHLILMGCKRIAHIAGPPNLLLTRNRLKGYLDALKAYGLAASDDLIRYSDLTIEQGISLTNELFDTQNIPPDGFFAICDSVAFGAMLTIKNRGWQIPDDIALAGFTDEPVAAIVEPALTTVSQPTYEIGQTAAQLFLDQIHNKDYQPVTKVLETRLVVRKSSMRLVLQG